MLSQYLRARPPLLHGYIAPFIILYLVWLYTWFVHFGFEEWLEAGYISGAGLVLCNVLVILSCHWSVAIMATMTCNRVSERDAIMAEWAQVSMLLYEAIIYVLNIRWCPKRIMDSQRWSSWQGVAPISFGSHFKS